jgi:hypothetical protein
LKIQIVLDQFVLKLIQICYIQIRYVQIRVIIGRSRVKSRVVYHGVASRFFGIGILPVTDLTGRTVFWLALLVWRELLFSTKGGWLYQKGSAPFLRDKGVLAKKMIPKCTDRDFLWYRYGKYQEIPTDTDRKIPIRYTTLVKLDT